MKKGLVRVVLEFSNCEALEAKTNWYVMGKSPCHREVFLTRVTHIQGYSIGKEDMAAGFSLWADGF